VILLLLILLLLALTGALAFVAKVILGVALGIVVGVVALALLVRWRFRRAVYGQRRRRPLGRSGRSRIEVLDRDHRFDV
jgi:hypothetical protein